MRSQYRQIRILEIRWIAGNDVVKSLMLGYCILNRVFKILLFCSGVGTGGTLSGIGETLKAKYPEIHIWAVEPKNAAILSGGSIGTHLQMGIGDGLIPKNLNTQIYEHIDIVTDEEAIETSRRLIREEGILCGISSGTNVTAALRLAKELGEGKTVVTVLPDTGERYFSTVLFD